MTIQTDVVIVGAGPVGLFQIFELGLLGLQAHVIEALDRPGGQCTELYPDKPIYDIPGLPVVGAQQLVDNLMQQAMPFDPVFHLGEQVVSVEKLDEAKWKVITSKLQEFHTSAVVIAGGVGAFEPVKLKLAGAEKHLNQSLFYSVNNPALHHGKDLVVLGGGDSALDWVLNLQPVANSVVLIHRSQKFKAAPASVDRMHRLCNDHEMQLLTGNVTGLVESNDSLCGLEVASLDGVTRRVDLDHLLVFFGLSPNLGPMATWPVDRNRNQFVVDPERFQTSQPGIYAVGDINVYPGKKKLILSGFHEAALAAFAIKEQLNPGKRATLQYTTTSTLMHQRLGVDGSQSDQFAA